MTPDVQNELKDEVAHFIEENQMYGPDAQERYALDQRMIDEEMYPNWNAFLKMLSQPVSNMQLDMLTDYLLDSEKITNQINNLGGSKRKSKSKSNRKSK